VTLEVAQKLRRATAATAATACEARDAFRF
jgi:hypothetical protein